MMTMRHRISRYVGHARQTAPAAAQRSRDVIREKLRSTLLDDFREHGAEVIARVEASGATIDDAPLPEISEDELATVMADWSRRGRQALDDLARDRPAKFIAIALAIAVGEL
jgi:hypothetical protein